MNNLSSRTKKRLLIGVPLLVIAAVFLVTHIRYPSIKYSLIPLFS